MFQFSAFASLNLCIQFRMTALIALPGFPIQKSPGHSSFDNSPELIAVCYVFHRLSAPRHPPCALYSLIIHPTPSEQGLDYYPKFLNHSRGVNDSALDDLNESISSIHSPISLSLSSFLFSISNRFFFRTRRTRRPYTRVGYCVQVFFSKKNNYSAE